MKNRTLNSCVNNTISESILESYKSVIEECNNNNCTLNNTQYSIPNISYRNKQNININLYLK